MARIASFYDAPMNRAAGLLDDFRLVFYPSHPDSYELTHVLLAKAGFDGRLGPDLTHVGSRGQLAAGTLPNTPEGRAQWIAHVQQLKTGARMPSYDRLDATTLAALAEWLGALR